MNGFGPCPPLVRRPELTRARSAPAAVAKGFTDGIVGQMNESV